MIGPNLWTILCGYPVRRVPLANLSSMEGNPHSLKQPKIRYSASKYPGDKYSPIIFPKYKPWWFTGYITYYRVLSQGYLQSPFESITTKTSRWFLMPHSKKNQQTSAFFDTSSAHKKKRGFCWDPTWMNMNVNRFLDRWILQQDFFNKKNASITSTLIFRSKQHDIYIYMYM